MSSQRAQPHLVQKLILVAGLACVTALPIRAQSQQIPAGTTGSLGSGPTTKAGTKQKKILHDALTTKTRAKLQAAMDANPDVR
jgi:hypothetical protein